MSHLVAAGMDYNENEDNSLIRNCRNSNRIHNNLSQVGLDDSIESENGNLNKEVIISNKLMVNRMETDGIVNSTSLQTNHSNVSNTANILSSAAEKDSQGITPSSGSNRREKTSNKKTWRDLSPSKKLTFTSDSSSSIEGSPTKIRSFSSDGSGKNKITWKDVSPSKTSLERSLSGGDCNSSSNCTCHTDVANQSNSITKSPKRSRSGNNNTGMTQTDSVSSASPTRTASPDECSTNDYFYDEDFIVQFDTNIRDSLMEACECERGKPSSVGFPHVLNGSYQRLKNYLRENVREHMESELSSSQNSMEVSTSEKEMMCSSDLLEFDSEPLFSSCGQAEICRQHQSTDSLDHLKCQAHGQELTCSKTSEGKLHVDCCPKKNEYFLSFDGSHGRDSASEFSFTTHDSEENNVADIQSDFSTDCEGDDICSDSFHFCKGHKDDSEVHRGVKRLHKKLATLPEDSTESCESLVDAKSLQRRPSPKRSPTRTRNMEAKIRHSSPNNTIDTNLRHCCRKRNTSVGTCSSKNKSVISWKHVKNLRKLGLLDNILDPSRSSSLPNLNIHSWHSLYGDKRSQCVSESLENYSLKRHSSSLLDLYQRLKNQSNPVSPETLENIETLLFNKGGYSDYSTTSSEDKDGSMCKLCCKTGLYNGYNCKQYRHSVHTADRPNSLNVLHDHCCHGVSLSKGFCCRSMVSKETVISPARVTTFLGTKNFSAQFPPATHDCAIQTSVNKDKIPYDNKQQQTSPTLCAKDELLSLVDKNLECNEFVKQKNGHSSVQELVHDACCNPVPHRSRSYHGTGSSRRCSVSPPRRMGQSAFYTHRSLPDLSFLGCPFSSDSECERSLFDPVQIPIIYTPDIPGEYHSCQCGKKGMRSASVPNFSNTESSSGKPKKPPRRSKSCSCTLHGVQSCRQCEVVSSSSGFSTSSTSSGIDPGYSDSKSRSLSCDLERLIYLPPHVQVVTSNGTSDGRKDNKAVNCNITERRFEKYTNEVHPGALKMPPRQNSLGHTTDGDTDPEDFLYSLREESSASSSSDTQSMDLGRHTCKQAFWETQRLGHIDMDCMTDEDYSSMPIPEIKMSDEHRPLKSCLRKNGNAIRSRSMNEGLLDGGSKAMIERKKANRHSCACDQYEILSEDKQAEFMNLLAAQNKAKVEEPLAEQPEDELEEEDDEEEEEVDIGTDCHDKQGKRKSVSFATELSFHSPVYSPQPSPKHPDETKGQGSSQEHTLTQKFVGLFKQERKTETSPSSVCSDDSGTEGPPQDFVNSSPELSDMDESQNMLTHKSDLLRNLAKSAENLVAHFAQTSQPFDKLRLGNSSETPELGDLILSEFCPAVAQVIGDGLKPYLAGISVFGKIQLSPWKVAEGSADLGPYTRAVHELVDQLKDQFLHYSNTQKFYAFIFGLLNLRLMDFWMGYIRHKDNVTKFYNTDSVLLMSNDKLGPAFENMLLTLQPLATLPFQIEFDIISQFSANSSKGYIKPDIESLEFSSPTDRPGLNKCNSLGEEASKALNWFGHSAVPKTKSFVNSASHRASPLSKLHDSAKKGFDFIGRMSSKTESDSSFDSDREMRSEECLSDHRVNTDSNTKSSDDVSADAEDSTDEEKTNKKSSASSSSLKPPSKIPTFAQRMLHEGATEKEAYKQTDYVFNDDEVKENSSSGSGIPRPAKPNSLQLKDETLTSTQNNGSPSKIIQFFDKLLLPKSTSNSNTPKGGHRWSWTGGQTGIPSPKSKKNDLQTSLPTNYKGMESKLKPKSFHSDSSLSSHGNNVHSHKLSKIAEDGEKITPAAPACQAKGSLTPIAVKIPGVQKMGAQQNRLKTFSVKSPRQSTPEKAVLSLSPEKPPRAHSVDKTVSNVNTEKQESKSRSPEKRSRIPRFSAKAKSVSDAVDENSNPKLSKSSLNKKKDSQGKKEEMIGKVYQSDKKEIIVVKDNSNDHFQKPEFGYVKTVVSLESEVDGCLKVGKDEYLEVVAQLDSEWLFCAHGKKEGMVRLKNVTSVTQRQEFENLHSDFYA